MTNFNAVEGQTITTPQSIWIWVFYIFCSVIKFSFRLGRMCVKNDNVTGAFRNETYLLNNCDPSLIILFTVLSTCDYRVNIKSVNNEWTKLLKLLFLVKLKKNMVTELSSFSSIDLKWRNIKFILYNVDSLNSKN